VALAEAWHTLHQRHDALRVAFRWRGRERAMQVACEGLRPPLKVDDWQALSAETFEARLETFLEDDRRTGFDLEAPPLYRVAAIDAPDGQWRLIWSVHHAIIDGRGIATVLREFLALYDAHTRSQPAPELPVQDSFLTYAAQEEAGNDWNDAAAYWRGALRGVDEPCLLPLATPEEAGTPYGLLMGSIGTEATDALRAFAHTLNVSMGTLIHAAWSIVLHRYTGREQVVFGATRALHGAPAVGLNINTLPMMATIARARRLEEWLPELREAWVAQRPHQRTPLPYIQQWVLGTGAQGLFDTYLVHERGTLEDLVLRGMMTVATRVSLRERTPAPVTLAIYERETIEIHLEFDGKRFGTGTMRQVLQHFTRVLAALPAYATAPIGAIPMLSEEELSALLRPPVFPGSFEPVHLAVARRAKRAPRAIAVEQRGATLDYATLERRANQIAHALRARGVKRGDIVAFMLPRCPDAIVTILAILKAGAAYLPIDPALPADRRSFKRADSGARLLVTLSAQDAPAPVFALQDEAAFIATQPTETPHHDLAPEDQAYVIYTSGSTGQPKGVVVTHGAIAAFVTGARKLYGITRRDRVLQFASFSFDAAAEEIYPALSAGATLVLRTDEMVASAPSFVEQCRAWDITVLDLPTAYWHLIVDSLERIRWPKRLRLVIIGGEAARPDKVRVWREQLGERFRLANTYGPTETTVAVTCAFLESAGAGDAVPIGWAFPYAAAYVLDPAGNPVPSGVPGELWIGGAQLARGYLNREEQTAAKFRPASWDPALRLYRTGDRVYAREDGALVYLDRVDRQVKLRGYRIELSEIEAVLRAVEGAMEAAVVLREDQPGLPYLCAYLAVPSGEPTGVIARARKAAAAALPTYMQPGKWVALETLPLNTSGKIDRRALPAPQEERADNARAPRTEMEEHVHAIWCAAFGAQAIGCDDDFLTLGGHSLLAAQITARVAAELAVEVPLRFFAGHATIATLAEHIKQAPRIAGEVIPRLAAGAVARLAPDQELLWVYERVYPGTPAYHIPVAFEVVGELDTGLLARALHAVVARHEALRTNFTMHEGAAALRVHSEARVPWREEDCLGLNDDHARRWLAAEAAKPFDIEREPLLRVALLHDGGARHVLCLTVHHMVSDGWSVGILAREWSDAYAALTRGETPTFPPLGLGYADVAAWRRERDALPQIAAERFWRTQLAPPVPRFHWPTTGACAVPSMAQGAQYPIHFPRALSEALTEMARAQGATPFAAFFALLSLALHRLTGQSDTLLGFSIAARNRPELEPLMGFFLATLLLRVRTVPGTRFDVFLREVRDGLWSAQEHQDFSFARLRALEGVAATSDGPPLLQVLFLMQTMPLAPLEIPGASTRTLNVDLGKALTDLSLELYPSSAGYTGWLEYQTALFRREDMARLADYLLALARQVVETPFATLQELPGWDAIPAPVEVLPVAPLHVAPPPAHVRINRTHVQPKDDAPPTEEELRLLGLFQRLLRAQNLSVNDNFFEHGGHSLLAILLLDRIEQTFGVRLAPVDVYQSPTARALARRMGGLAAPLDRVVQHIRPGGTRTPLFFVGSTDMVPPLLPYLDPAQPIYGLNIFGLLPDHGPVPRLTVQGIAEAYVRELRRVQAKGPYRFAAYCRDTMLALEVAQQLFAAGEVVDRLIAIDFFWDSTPRYSRAVRHLLNLRDFGMPYVREKFRETFRQLYERQARLRARFALRHREDTAEEALPQNHRNTAFISAYYAAVYAYNVTAYPGHVHNVLVSEWGIDALPEWDDLADGGTTLHLLKACHHNLWNPPQDQDLATVITACLADNPGISARPTTPRR
jgi:amino acid adenylation domain-containing protein